VGCFVIAIITCLVTKWMFKQVEVKQELVQEFELIQKDLSKLVV